jgi:non-ribosomal peptide synthetase component F
MLGSSTNPLIKLSFNTAHLSTKQAINVAQVLEVATKTVLRNAHLHIKDLDLLPDAHKAQIQHWNASPPEYINDCIHHQFNDLASKQPDKIAVDAWDGKLSYSELAIASSHLAQQLIATGICKGDAVMACCEKSKYVTIAWMGIFKAGAVLVPVDMGQPLARLEQIQNVSKAKAVVSTLQNLPMTNR